MKSAARGEPSPESAHSFGFIILVLQLYSSKFFSSALDFIMPHAYGFFRNEVHTNLWTAYPYDATDTTQQQLNDAKWKLRNMDFKIGRLQEVPKRFRRLPAVFEIDTFEGMAENDYVSANDFVFQLKFVSYSKHSATGILLYQVENDTCARVQDGKPGVEYLWDLNFGEQPHLQYRSPAHFEGLSADEKAAIEFMYLNRQEAEHVKIEATANQYGAVTAPEPYPKDWTSKVYYKVRVEEPLTSIHGGDYKVTVLGRITQSNELTYSSSGTPKDQLQLVLFCSGTIFELTPHGNRLFGIFDGLGIKMERLRGSHHMWVLRPDCFPILKPTPTINKLTKPESQVILEYHSMTPITERAQVFAVGRTAPSIWNQEEDTPACGIFGPGKNYTGKFSRQGRNFIQDGSGHSSKSDILHSRRFEEICGTTKFVWHVSTRTYDYWIPEEASMKFAVEKKSVGNIFTPVIIDNQYNVIRKMCRETGEYGPAIRRTFDMEELGLVDEEEYLGTDPNSDDETDVETDCVFVSESDEEKPGPSQPQSTQPPSTQPATVRLPRKKKPAFRDFKEESAESDNITSDEEPPTRVQQSSSGKAKPKKPVKPKTPINITLDDTESEEPRSSYPRKPTSSGPAKPSDKKPSIKVNGNGEEKKAVIKKKEDKPGTSAHGTSGKRPNQSVGSYSSVLSANPTPAKRTQADDSDEV